MFKKKKKNVLIMILVVFLLIAGGFVLFKKTQSDHRYANVRDTISWDEAQKNNTVISPQERSDKRKIVTIDFSLCSKGSDEFGFGLGSTSFYFEGVKDGKCHFYMGTEIENPTWDGYLDEECFVPTDYIKEFVVEDNGAELTFLGTYCSST